MSYGVDFMNLDTYYNNLLNIENKSSLEKEILHIINDMDYVIKRHTDIIKIKKNNPLLKMDDPLDYMYIIIEGEFKVVNEFENGKLYQPNLIPKGESVGVMEIMVNHKNYISSVIATRDSTVIRIATEQAIELINKSHFFTKKALYETSKYFFLQGFRRGEHLLQDTLFVLVDYLIRYAESNETDDVLVISLTREEISNRTGINIRTLYRNIAKLKDKNVISIKNKKIYIDQQQKRALYQVHSRLKTK